MALDAVTAEAWLDGFVAVYGAAFAGPPYHRDEREAHEFGRSLTLHLKRAGFCAMVATTPEGAAAGFAYGYLSLPGQWWRDHVAPALGWERAAAWLGDAFQLAELAVAPAWQGRGLGAALHDALLDRVATPRAVLSTLDSSTVAFGMYRRRGWEQLLADFRFPGVARPYAILGKVLAPTPNPGANERMADHESRRE